MELKTDGIFLNTAVPPSKNSFQMTLAINLAVQA